jgi:hypothetical protein
MSQFMIILAVLFALVFFISAPLRRPGAGAVADESPAPATAEGRVLDLQAAREAKYREILDAELDHQTGKLSDGDYHELDATLRAEALEILHALDRAHSSSGTA